MKGARVGISIDGTNTAVVRGQTSSFSMYTVLAIPRVPKDIAPVQEDDDGGLSQAGRLILVFFADVGLCLIFFGVMSVFWWKRAEEWKAAPVEDRTQQRRNSQLGRFSSIKAETAFVKHPDANEPNANELSAPGLGASRDIQLGTQCPQPIDVPDIQAQLHEALTRTPRSSLPSHEVTAERADGHPPADFFSSARLLFRSLLFSDDVAGPSRETPSEQTGCAPSASGSEPLLAPDVPAQAQLCVNPGSTDLHVEP
eukprot:1205236-Rhodomonas_salina.1